ncbi:glycosyltransferase [Aquisphaera insulae]|uniref:glycosyltransferase n=1 Tax=Aquisphaera insulae TaxID=2712864 RepID=UPI0013EBD97D|nr:glycosyltransferase [Aquisphaera insulae]
MDVAGSSEGIRGGDAVSDRRLPGLDGGQVLQQAAVVALREEILKLRLENSRLGEAGRGQAAALQGMHAALEATRASIAPAAPPPPPAPESILLQKARVLRRRLFREGHLSGRCWHALSRFLEMAATDGTVVASGRAARKVARKIRRAANPPAAATPPVAAMPVEPPPPPVLNRFEDLPWRYHAAHARDGRSRHYKVLLGSHSATRTGAPACFVQLARELSRLPGVECWIYSQDGGELAGEFAEVAPILFHSDLIAAGIPAEAIPDELARRFRDHAGPGVAILNTIVMHRYHAAFAAHGVPVLSWIHELQLSIEYFGGRTATDRIAAGSRRIIVPAEAVRRVLVEQYEVDPARVMTFRYGLEARTRDLEWQRKDFRRRVRAELEIPDGAPIVLACGTVELRKGADLFSRVCRRVLEKASPGEPAAEARFLWIGSGPYAFFQDWLIQDIERSLPAGRLLFAGPRDDMVPYFMAADVFALTSREDPCPFANLEAMESGLAAVAFEGAGGAPEALQDAGVCVPYLDVEAMADAILGLLRDPERAAAMGRRGREIIRGEFTWPRFMGRFVRTLRDDYGYHVETPLKVSVIVPNYRHAPYLEERLRGIFNQSRRPCEIIFLDNASPDDSVAVARRLAEESPVPMQIVVNEENNGSPFLQWLKGLSMATGDLVWIAEADDSCTPDFLERLVPEFYDPEVKLAYCQSALIDSKSQRLADTFLAHTDDISTTRWHRRYMATAEDDVELALSQKNTVPNASAVVFRRPERLDFADELSRYRFAGDWLFYALQIRSGKIAYLPNVMNLYRRHEQTMTHQAVRCDMYAAETLQVKARIFEMYPLSRNAMAGSLARSMMEYGSLAREFGLEPPRLSDHAAVRLPLERLRGLLEGPDSPAGRPRVLIILGDMTATAGNISTIHLAAALAEEHEVFLCNVSPSRIDAGMEAMIDPRVVYLEGTPGPSTWSAWAEGQALLADSGERRLRLLGELVEFHRIDAIHAQGEGAGRLARILAANAAIPWFGRAEDSASAPDLPSGDGPAASGLFFDPDACPGGADRIESDDRPPRIPLPMGLLADRLPGSTRRRDEGDDGDVRFHVTVGPPSPDPAWHRAVVAAEILNALPAEDRSGRRARLVLVADQAAGSIPPEVIRESRALVLRGGRMDRLAALADCDVLLSLGGDSAEAIRLEAAFALGYGIPIIAAGPLDDSISVEAEGAGAILSDQEGGGSLTVSLAAAMLRYLKDPGLAADHGRRASRLFKRRLDATKAARVCSRALRASIRTTTPAAGSDVPPARQSA